VKKNTDPVSFWIVLLIVSFVIVVMSELS